MKALPLIVIATAFFAFGFFLPHPKQKNQIALSVDRLPSDLPRYNQSSKFAARCPYCGQVTISKSCYPNGGQATTNGPMQTWHIQFICPSCSSVFSDTRQQPAPVVRSIMLQP